MANTMRWRKGNTNDVITKAVATATVIEIGDLVEMESDGTVLSVADHTWDTNIATVQEQIHDKFLGVAQQQSRTGDTDPIRVAITGVHEFDCAAATFELGALVGPAKQTGNAAEDQKVVAVATANLAIGRVAQRYATNTTSVLVDVVGVISRSGPLAPA